MPRILSKTRERKYFYAVKKKLTVVQRLSQTAHGVEMMCGQIQIFVFKCVRCADRPLGGLLAGGRMTHIIIEEESLIRTIRYEARFHLCKHNNLDVNKLDVRHHTPLISKHVINHARVV